LQAIKKILVVGGAGYIGSVVTAQALSGDYKVRVLDNLSFGGESLLPVMSHPGFEFQRGDIRRPQDIATAVAGMDAIIHLAAIVGDPACAKDPALAEAVNGEAPRRLLTTALDEGVRRFVFASTCSNYGRMSTPDEMVDETSPLNPVSLYAELKVGFEQHLLEQDSTSPVVLRFATAYGLSPRPRFDLTVNEFTRDLVLGRPLEIYGELFWRPYCHIDDLAAACLMALAADDDVVARRAFNVGSASENYQKKRLGQMICEQLPGSEDLVSHVHRDEDPRDYRVRFDRIESELGFGITRTVRDGIGEIIHALRSGIIAAPDSDRYRNS